MKYYIWADGEEHGPYDFDQLYESWKEGTLPKGFLWRRETASQFSMPEAMEAEKLSRSKPEASTTNPIRRIQKRKFRVKIGTGAGIASVIFVLLGLFASSVQVTTGYGLVLFGILIACLSWCDALLRSAGEIVGQLDQIRQILAIRDDIDIDQ